MESAIIDVDGTLCPSLFSEHVHNDNSKLYTDEFKEKLANVKPYKWVTGHPWMIYDKIIACTGRIKELNPLTLTWLENHVKRDIAIINAEWDDSLPTRELSYQNYVETKIDKIINMSSVIARSRLPLYDVNVILFEDDMNVLDGLLNTGMKLRLVFEGNVYDYETWKKGVENYAD